MKFLAPILVLMILVGPKFAHAGTIGVPTNFLALNTGLVGWWTFDGKNTNWTSGTTGTTKDLSGNGHTGTLTGMNQATAPIGGKIGQALSFDGSIGSYVSFLAAPGITLSNVFTMSAWINYRSCPSSGWCPVIATTNISNASWFIVGGVQSFYSGGDHYSNTQVSFNVWHHVVIVGTGSDVLFYLDGKPDGSAGIAAPTATWDLFGSDAVSGDNDAANGSIDDVRIYNRAFSATEITHLYNIGSAKYNVTPADPLKNSLVGWWTFDGKDMIPNVRDKSGNGNNGNIVGATTTVPGKLGQALKFDGISQFINMGDISSLNIGTSDWTASAWIKTSAVNGAIIGKLGYIGSGPDAWVMSVSGTGRLSGWLYQLSGDVLTSADDGVVLTNGKWHNVVITWNRSGNLVRYVDGVTTGTPLGITSLAGQNLTSTKAVEIGARDQSGDELFFNGSIDDVRVYNRELSAAEVSRLYTMSK